MANALYATGLNAFARGDVTWKATGGATIRCALTKSAYTPNLATDQYLSTIGVNYVGTSGNNTRGSCPQVVLADPVGGVCASSNLTLTISAVPTAVGACNGIILFADSGSDATSQLVMWMDTATGLPVTPTGSDITITWDSGANKIFKL